MDTVSTNAAMSDSLWKSSTVRFAVHGTLSSSGWCIPQCSVSGIFLAFLLSLVPTFAIAQKAPTESQVKAAYLFNFGKFARWQADRPTSDVFEICILGKDPFGAVLDATVAGENIDGKKIIVNRLATIQEATHCSVLFVSSSEESRIGAILPVAQHLNLLTVSDVAHFADRGGIIGLVTQQGKVRFEVNRGAAAQADLALSSELLRVATRVIEPSGAHK